MVFLASLITGVSTELHQDIVSGRKKAAEGSIEYINRTVVCIVLAQPASECNLIPDLPEGRTFQLKYLNSFNNSGTSTGQLISDSTTYDSTKISSIICCPDKASGRVGAYNFEYPITFTRGMSVNPQNQGVNGTYYYHIQGKVI